MIHVCSLEKIRRIHKQTLYTVNGLFMKNQDTNQNARMSYGFPDVFSDQLFCQEY